MRVAVIGSSGGMGRYFVEYFLSHGHEVTGSDIRETPISDVRFRRAASNREAVERAEVVLVATPIGSTVETVRGIAPRIGRGVRVIEISSVKGGILRELRPILRKRGAALISIHPLFGPSLPPSAEMKICVIGTGRRSVEFAKGLFPEARLIPIKEREHDRAMGVILSLTHLVNIAYAATVARHMTPGQFRRLESPTSAVQLSIAEGVLAQSPALYSYIQLENEHSAQYAGELIENLAQLRRIIARKDRKAFESLFSGLSKFYADDSRTALESIYKAFEAKQKR